jgi:succinyl-diaminopimelate desuccinylase
MHYYGVMSHTNGSNVLSIFSDLIDFQTISGHTKEVDACFDYAAAFLEKQGMHVVRLTSNGFPSIIATSQTTKTPGVLLQAHMDVVPAKSEFFKMTEKEDRLYGRGVFDMKFAAACGLQLAQDLKDELHNYDFGIMFSSDEEIGGTNGVSYLLDQGYGADVCILPDGGNDWQIEASCNALWIVRLSANGQTAHGSRPWEGQNAINNLLGGISEIQQLFGELKPLKNSITISKIQGGSAVNQVPDHAEAVLDMRFISNEEYTRNREIISKIAAANDLQLETVGYVEARNVDVTQPSVAAFLTIAEQITGKPIAKTHSFGTSDACYFSDHGIPTIVIRPNGGGAHSDHEWIDKAGVEQFYEVIKQYVLQITKIQP